MFKELMYKWFGLTPTPCNTCEILREQLDKSERERGELLHRLLDKDKPEPLIKTEEEHVPIRPQYTPWRVRQQLLEAEDRKQAQLLKEKNKEIKDSSRSAEIQRLEEELGVAADIPRGESGGVAFTTGE